MSQKTVTISPQYLNIKKNKIKTKTTKIIPSQVNINSSNIRQYLLDKLKQNKNQTQNKTKKAEPPLIKQNSFDDNCRLNETNVTNEITEIKNDIIVNQVIEHKVNEVIQQKMGEISIEKPYGNLKNGTKPTFKIWNSPEPLKSVDILKEPLPESFPIEIPKIAVEPKIVVEEKEVTQTFKLGKNIKNKTISVLIKDKKTRRNVDDIKLGYKKINLGTIKNYLKENNLIKFGTTAPSKLLREMYESSNLCGNIINENATILLHNYDK